MRLRTVDSGFSLIELMVVLVIFLIVTGAVFGLLNTAQVRYRSEQQFLDSLQGARTGLEQLMRDVHRAGYPALNAYDSNAAGWVAAGGVPSESVAVPFVGMRAGAIDQTCIVDTTTPPLSTCVVPGPFELILETDLDPENTIKPARVEWVYYRLDTPGNGLASPPAGGVNAFSTTRTLYRRVLAKDCTGPPWVPLTCVGGNPLFHPVDADSGPFVPFVDSVLNDPAKYAADPEEAVFRYRCAGGATTCTPANIGEVYVVLRARAFSPDLQTRQVRALTLQSAARRLNPPE